VWSLRKRKAVEMQVCEGKSEFMGSSRTCFKSRKRHGGREQVLASLVARGSGDDGATWKSEEGASRGREGGGGGAEKNRERRTGGRRRRTILQFSKSSGTLL
jgi:hypothetical protein